MANDFLAGAGCVLKIKKGNSGSAFNVEGWSDAIKGVSKGLITIDSVDPTDGDIAVPVVAADDFRVLYRFGRNFGSINISGTAYLGEAGSGGEVMGILKSTFESVRLSTKKNAGKISIANGFTCKAYLTTISITGADAQFNKVTYAIKGIVAPDAKGSK